MNNARNDEPTNQLAAGMMDCPEDRRCHIERCVAV